MCVCKKSFVFRLFTPSKMKRGLIAFHLAYVHSGGLCSDYGGRCAPYDFSCRPGSYECPQFPGCHPGVEKCCWYVSLTRPNKILHNIEAHRNQLA